ncbi:hypothetical protein JL108_04155 [Aeromicrobium sp. YIM 150415]|uniref:aldose 1-epimerase n=1 Tax=Aeromicrobium sp. YIM 150415 TaxID=2803912 RepID=UPI001963B242|nr:hypothetical protein [Aeromicrobium sp. YIM 150415]MBM9462631.1 hypothetical protein [Aeromicrobium sp. YIM 150415]
MPELLRLVDDGVEVTIDPSAGGRITSLRFGDHEVVGGSGDPDEDPSTAGGIFAMVPWAGRWRGHRAHGLGRDRAWRVDGSDLVLDILDGPLPGSARLRYRVGPQALHIGLEWQSASTGAPAVLGLHPWLRREVSGSAAAVELSAEFMLERGDDHLPTGRRVPVPPGPWDDCFRLRSAPVVRWPGVLALKLDADTPWWVVYTERDSAICLEPQTAPPGALDRADAGVDLHRRSIRLSLHAEEMSAVG